MGFFGKKGEENRSTEQFLREHGVGPDAINLSVPDRSKSTSTEDYLEAYGVNPDALKTNEDRANQLLKHRLFGRTLVLLSLVIPMSIVPFWLMALLSLPAFNKKPYSDVIQAGLLSALATDFIGLYYVITRDLFPQGALTRQEESEPKDEDEEN